MYSPRESLRDSDGLGTGEIKRHPEVEVFPATRDNRAGIASVQRFDTTGKTLVRAAARATLMTVRPVLFRRYDCKDMITRHTNA